MADSLMDGLYLSTSGAQEAWYEHVKEGGGMDEEDFKAWYEQRDKFDQMDEIDQLISELDTPLEFGNPVGGMDAVRRLDNVIDELVKIGDPRAVEPLIKVVENPEFSERNEAIEALGELGDKRAVKTLVKALEDKDRNIRQSAAEALDGMGWDPDD